MELGKAPRVHTALSLALAMGDTLSNMSQVLKNYGAARSGVLDNAFGEDVIVVSSLPKQLTRTLFQVPFSRLGATFLKLATDTEHAAFLLFPPTIPQELTIGGNCRSIKTQVNTNHLFGRCDLGSRNGYNGMQEIAPVMEAKISRTNLATGVLYSVFGDRKTDLNTTRYSRKGAFQLIKLYSVRTGIIANRARPGYWTANRLECGRLCPAFLAFFNQLRVGRRVLLRLCERRFHRFRCLDARRTDQLRGKIRELCTQGIVGCFMQLDSIAASALKSVFTYGIKASRVFWHRSIKNGFLRVCRIQLYDYRSVHAESISYIRRFFNRMGLPSQAPRKEDLFHPLRYSTGVSTGRVL